MAENITIEISADQTANNDNDKLECDCCCDTFNKTIRSKIECPNPECSYAACKSCVRHYLLSTAKSAHCMNCKVAWNQRFIVDKLNNSFVNKEYKEHRQKLLLERQLSMLPESMPALARIEQEEEYRQKYNEISDLISQLKKKQRQLSRDFHNGTKGTKTKQEVNKFIMPCPDDNCRGFLSSAYKCELCRHYACPKCLVITGLERDHGDHVCDEDLVKTTQLIKSTSKPCPSCGERIMRAQGCDQMWCTKCKTPFSWKTGKIDTGVIHNPHFFEYQRNTNNNLVPRNPGDVICGGLPGNLYQTTRKIKTIFTDKFRMLAHNLNNTKCTCCDDMNDMDRHHKNIIMRYANLCQLLTHINHYELHQYRQELTNLSDHEDIRVNYLRKKINKDQLGATISRRDKKHKKITEVLHIYELVVAVGNDMIRHINAFCNENTQKLLVETCGIICNEFTTKFKEIDQFIDYVNTQFKYISVTYNQSVKQFDKETYKYATHNNDGPAGSYMFKFKKSDLETSA